MKKIIVTMVMALMTVISLEAQSFNTQIGEAQSFYKSGDLHGTRFALQTALNEIDRAIGAEILKIIPEKMDDMIFVESDDNITATSMGFAGLFVSRSYLSEGKNASITIISDAPFLTGINAILALPSFASDPNQKKIKVGNNRALLQKSEDETGEISWDVQLPFGSTLLTFHCEGVKDEKTIIDMANTIPMDKIARFAQ
ncbi:MAG: hypothetical protein CVT92_05135 [Bacteroidetes bacterium HGW-Bacteroidetes-1]|jgi:hypothetical protein|nr:MAG: hypothetical protein CVT92_05135 [Bacteroidetes bacterium HGW-Bacteroidetes-1]